MTDTEARLRAQIRARKSWVNTADRSARTLPARTGLYNKFERDADPNNEYTPAEPTSLLSATDIFSGIVPPAEMQRPNPQIHCATTYSTVFRIRSMPRKPVYRNRFRQK